MEAQVWTLIGILAAAVLGLGTLFFIGYQHLSSRIDVQGAELRAAIDAQGAEMRAQGAELRAAIVSLGERLEARLGRLETLFMSHLEQHAG